MSNPVRDEIRLLLDDVSTRTGLHFRERHISQLRETVQRAVKASGSASIPDFRRWLQTKPGAFDDFVGELTVGETYFFRNPAQFEFIRDSVLPDMVQRHGPRGGPRMWSAGCSSGEEAYSLAILLEEAGIPGTILATDISRPALARAREARYREWSLRSPSALSARPYLTMADGQYTLDPAIRRRVIFEYLNLAEDVYPSLSTDTWGLDLILCRNVLIYFDRDTMARVCQRFWDCLVPGGWLVLGASDPRPMEFADFKAVNTPSGLLFRRPQGNEQDANLVDAESQPTPPLDLSSIRTTDADLTSPLPVQHSTWDQAAPPSSDKAADPLAGARAALQAGENERAIELTRHALDSATACIIHVRALTNCDVEEAERVCSKLVTQHPLSTELHYLHAILLMHVGREDEAVERLRRLLFLDRSLAIAHFTQGTALRRLGRLEESRRAFRNAMRQCEGLAPDHRLSLGEGETAERLRQAAERQMDLLSDNVSVDERPAQNDL